MWTNIASYGNLLRLLRVLVMRQLFCDLSKFGELSLSNIKLFNGK